MGWLWFEKPSNIKEYFREQTEWENESIALTVLDSAIVHFNEYYAAVERIDKTTGKRDVFAMVCMLAYDHSQFYNFGYKDMDETCGPNQTECPKRILKLLTPTDHEYARNWRAACWERHERRGKANGLKHGQLVKFKWPMKFTDGREHSELYVVKTGRRTSFSIYPSAYGDYKIDKGALSRYIV